MDAEVAADARSGVVRCGRARVGALEIAYDELGPLTGRPLVMIMGIGSQRIMWDERFCAALVGHGFRVIRFDHRDVGESTYLDGPAPRPMPMIARRLVGAKVEAPYTLSDMAGDVVGLLDALAIDRAHVVGASLGGMVAQHLAIEHPGRLRSFTSIMSTSGGRRFLPRPYALKALFRPLPRSAEQAGEHYAQTFAVIGSPRFARDPQRLKELGAAAYRRGTNPRGFLRQFAAIAASGDRTARLPGVRVPALVIHGSCDPLIPFEAGRAVAALVPGATWLPIAGMGHDLPPALWPTFAAAIARHAARAEASEAARAS